MKNKYLFWNTVRWQGVDRDAFIKHLAHEVEERPLGQQEGRQQIWWDVNGNRFWELSDTNTNTDPVTRLTRSNNNLTFLTLDRCHVLEWQDALKIFKELKVV